MKLEKLEISHGQLLGPKLRKLNSRISEYSFPNLYLFRNGHNYHIGFEERLFISGKSYDGHSYIMPTEDVGNIPLDYLKKLLSEYEYIFPLPEEVLGYFPENQFNITFNDGEMDYVYSVDKMSTYSGKKLHSKKNLLYQFQDNYEHSARPLSNDLFDDARHVVDEWAKEADTGKENTDYYPSIEAIEKHEILDLCGGIYYADGEPAGLILGEELNDDTFAVHFAKGRTKFKGIYQFMFNNVANILPSKYKFMNFEQDLNLENLRAFKSSYAPEYLVKKGRVSLRK